MRRSLLRAVGAFLLWCASLAGTGMAHAAPETAPRTPAPMRLGDAGTRILGAEALYWVDPHGTESVDRVEAAAAELPWRPRRRDQQNWPDGGALWVQFEASVPSGQQWYLELGTAIHHNVQLYYRNAQGAWVVQEAGTGAAVSRWPVPGRLPTFALAPDATRSVRYWMRVEDEQSEFVAPLILFREGELQDSREREQFALGAFFGLAGLIALASLANGLAFRDRAFLAFALYILLLAGGMFGRAGLGAQHLWQDAQVWNDTVLHLWPGAAVAAALWFVKVLTEPARLSRALDLGVWGLIAALLAAVAVHVVIAGRSSNTLVLSLTGVALIALVSMLLWAALERRDNQVRLIALAFLPAVLFALFPLARSFGLIPGSVLTRFGLFIGVALELPLLYYALNLRLMERREAELRAGALSRTDALTGLPHRQALVERLDASLAHARAHKEHCGLLGVRIANLDALSEEFGREVVDKLLVVAASHLRRVVVGYDMAARVGEREFAVLLESPLTPEMLTSRAQQVVASGLRQVDALPAAVTLKFHVTAALLPNPQLDGGASLQWVLEALDQFEQD
ncbi:MAG TPA: 7TM diverse intracellular signaling domain-containing protein, partial [Ramlibacter sp.]|nr:7TM diverse intracellular signaling domain-containing protein [Ramlibacter sp.]